jgi:hypothetical protein
MQDPFHSMIQQNNNSVREFLKKYVSEDVMENLLSQPSGMNTFEGIKCFPTK